MLRCSFQVRELTELRKAHQKRAERLKSVQENYRNVKDQLKTLEAEYYGLVRFVVLFLVEIKQLEKTYVCHWRRCPLQQLKPFHSDYRILPTCIIDV